MGHCLHFWPVAYNKKSQTPQRRTVVWCSRSISSLYCHPCLLMIFVLLLSYSSLKSNLTL